MDEKERLNPKTPDLNKKESTRKRGDPLSDEIRAKISETMKKKWANSTYAEERKKAREALYEVSGDIKPGMRCDHCSPLIQ